MRHPRGQGARDGQHRHCVFRPISGRDRRRADARGGLGAVPSEAHGARSRGLGHAALTGKRKRRSTIRKRRRSSRSLPRSSERSMLCALRRRASLACAPKMPRAPYFPRRVGGASVNACRAFLGLSAPCAERTRRGMKIGIPKEIRPGERRVAATPDTVSRLLKLGFEVQVESQAGAGASFRDADYTALGASIVPDARELWEQSELVLKVQPPEHNLELGAARGRAACARAAPWSASSGRPRTASWSSDSPRGAPRCWRWTKCRASRARRRWTRSARWRTSPATAR